MKKPIGVKLAFWFLALSASAAFAGASRVIDADSLISSDHTKTYSLPSGTADTLAGVTSSATLTNKTISGGSNTFSQLPVGGQTLQPILTPYPNGTATAFTLSTAPPAGIAVVLYLDGDYLAQGAGLDYTISGSTITMTTAPATGQRLIAVYSQY